MTQTSATHIMRLPAVMHATGLSRSSIYAFIQQKSFPAPIRLGLRAVGWKADQIESWIEKRSAGSAK